MFYSMQGTKPFFQPFFFSFFFFFFRFSFPLKKRQKTHHCTPRDARDAATRGADRGTRHCSGECGSLQRDARCRTAAPAAPPLRVPTAPLWPPQALPHPPQRRLRQFVSSFSHLHPYFLHTPTITHTQCVLSRGPRSRSLTTLRTPRPSSASVRAVRARSTSQHAQLQPTPSCAH